MIPMTVLGLTLDGTTNMPILVLQQKYALMHEGKELEKRILPIWVGASEAMSLSLALNDIHPERPLPHDLLENTLAALGARLTAISLVDLREGTFYARMELLQGERLYQVDCRPSDAITLALRAGLDIQVAESVLETSIEARVHPHATEAERRPSDVLEKIVHKAGQGALVTPLVASSDAQGAGTPPAVPPRPTFAPAAVPEAAPAAAPAAVSSRQAGSGDEQRLDEQRLADLLRKLEPATKRMM